MDNLSTVPGKFLNTGGSSLRKKLTNKFVDKLWAGVGKSKLRDPILATWPDFPDKGRPMEKTRNEDTKERTEHDQESLNK